MNEDRKLVMIVWLLSAVLFISALGLVWVAVQLLGAM